jgi:hypothetical protein
MHRGERNLLRAIEAREHRRRTLDLSKEMLNDQLRKGRADGIASRESEQGS